MPKGKSTRDYIPRLGIDLREDQLASLQELLPFGVRRRLFEVVIDDLIEMLRVDAEAVMGGLFSKKLKFTMEKRVKNGK